MANAILVRPSWLLTTLAQGNVSVDNRMISISIKFPISPLQVPPIGDQARFNRLLEDLDRVQGQPFLSSCHTIPPFKAGEKGSDPAIPALEKERAAILISTRILIPVLVLVLGSGSGSGPFLEAQRKAQRVSHASDTRGHARGRRGSRRPISDNRQLGPFLFGIYLQSHVRQNITLHA